MPQRSYPALPESFIFGVANSDHQTEAFDERYIDIRDVWDREKKLTRRGRATDFWHRYAEDIELARNLGARAFRFSIAWSRVEPNPGEFNDEALDHYRDLVAAIKAAGMEPVLTLHHFTWPTHVQARGGLLAEDFPSIFARYAAEVVARLGQDVRYWITFNEPTVLILGYIKPWWESEFLFPPGMPPEASMLDQIDAVHVLMRNLFLAHTSARAVIKRQFPGAMVGANPALLGLPMWLHKLINWNASRRTSPNDWRRREGRLAERTLVERGAIDVLAATLTLTAERAEQMTFSRVYYMAGQTLLVKAASNVGKVEDVRGRKVAVVKSSTAEGRIRTLIPEAVPQSFEDYAAALKALEAGEVEAILADDSILLGMIAKEPSRFRFVGSPLTQEPYVVATAKGNSELSDAVNKAVLQFIESGEWTKSYARHFPGEPPIPPVETPLQASLESVEAAAGAYSPESLPRARSGGLKPAPRGTLLRRIQDRGYIVAGVKEDVPGFGYRDPQTGKWSGLEVDLVRAIARYIFGNTGKIRFYPVKTKNRISLLRSILRIFDPLLRIYSILSSAILVNWWYLGMSGKLPEFLCPSECVGQQDFVGFDYYWGVSSLSLTRVQGLLDALAGRFDKVPVWPEGLYELIKYHADMFPGKEIHIIENGCHEEAAGIGRADYLRMHIRQVQRAHNDGANIKVYLCWSITSNREWGLKFGPHSDFGLYHVELDADPDLKRTETESSRAYKEIVANRGV